MRPGALDALDVSDATCLTRTRSPRHRASERSMPGHAAFGRSCHGICLPHEEWQSIFLLDAAVSAQITSGRRVSRHHGLAGCHGTEHRSAAGSKHSDSIRLYLLHLMYIYICYYHTSCTQRNHPRHVHRCNQPIAAINPSP